MTDEPRQIARYPERVTTDQIKRYCDVGPKTGICIVGARFYGRDGDRWVLYAEAGHRGDMAEDEAAS